MKDPITDESDFPHINNYQMFKMLRSPQHSFYRGLVYAKQKDNLCSTELFHNQIGKAQSKPIPQHGVYLITTINLKSIIAVFMETKAAVKA